MSDDKYPTQSGRRRFVKGVVGSATLASVGTGAAAAIGTATSSTGKGGGPRKYIGIEHIGGPAPRAMPIIPLEIDSDGAIKGVWPSVSTKLINGKQTKVAETQIGGVTYSSEWFQYCGVQTYSGIDPAADQDNYFRSAPGAPYSWQSDKDPGEKLYVDDFSDYESWGNGIGHSGLGKPGQGTWRSKGLSPQETVPVQVLRSPKIEDYSGPNEEFVKAACPKGFIGWMDKCTHFCCVPGFKAYAASEKFGAKDEVYCPCHQSVYDPFSPVEKSFVALPRPGES